jgi:hypothetical protein
MKKKRGPNGRDYAQEEKLNDTKKQRAEQAARMRARRKMEREGKVSKHDNKDVDHKDMNPLNNSSKNLRVQSSSKNRRRQGKHK